MNQTNQAENRGVPETLQRSIVSYYDETQLDYRFFWLNKRNRAVHFGYFNNEVTKHSQALENLNKVLADKVAIDSDDHVLDAGCGQGGSSFWLAENRDCKVEGITLVPHQVNIASKEAIKRQLTDKVSFSVQDYCNTKFPDEHFSVVWACESQCHAYSKAAFYQEAWRVLKPGGRLVVADYIRRSRPLSAPDEQLLKNWLSGWSIPGIDTWAEHEQNLKNAGFALTDHTDATKNISPSLSRLYKMSKKLLVLGTFLYYFKIRNKVKHGNQTGSVFQFEALQKDLWYYSIFTAIKPHKE
jgi:tocopherol O-methyltransferase